MSDPRDIAQHMLSMYRDSTYGARQRAVDHALSYPIGEPQYAFWNRVVAAIDAINEEEKS